MRRAFVCCALLPPYTLLATCTIRAGRPYIAVNAGAQCRLHDWCRRGSATLTSMKQHSHRLVKKLTSSTCRATRYGQRLRTVLSGSPRCTRATMPRQFGVRGFRLGRALDFNMSLHLEELQVYDSLPLGASAYDTCYTVTRSTMAAPMGASTTGDGAVPLAVRLPLTWFFLTPPFGARNGGACRSSFGSVATIDERVES